MLKKERLYSPFNSYAPNYAEVKVLENVKNFDREWDFTEAYRDHINEHVAIREARCLKVLFPKIFQDIQPGDIFAGRTRYRQIGFGLENASGGPGFYCYEKNLRSEMRNSDIDFYEQSGGGITLSGGEPMGQFPFAVEILQACKERGIHTCIETSGFAPQHKYQEILPLTDLFLFDYKATEMDAHQN